MKKTLRVLFAVFVVGSLFFNSLPTAKACGPSFIEPIFEFSVRPENLVDFARGNVGIIQPNLNRSALFAAYRHLNNIPFSPSEQKDLERNWKAEYERIDQNEAKTSEAIKIWIEARKKVLGDEAEPKIYAARSYDGGYDFFPNCTTGAFETATKTLAARIAKSAANADVKDWVRAQDQVFGNCSETKAIPADAKSDAPGWLKNDRAYQIAAANFYAMKYDEAKDQFAKIAQNSSSEWSEISAYLVARTIIRQASAASDDYSTDEKIRREKYLGLYRQASDELNKIIADKSLAKVHGASKQLLNLVKYRLNPTELHRELAAKLVSKNENSNFFQDLTDYRWLLDKATVSDDSSDETKLLFKTVRQESDLTDWIFAMQSLDKDAFDYAFAKWESTKNDAWLVAALTKAKKDSANTGSLIDAAKTLNRNSSAFLSANYHAIRLLTDQGNFDAARAIADSILNDKSLKLNTSMRNGLYSERMKVAQNVDEFVKFAQRRPAAFGSDGSNFQLEDVSVIPKEGDDYNKKDREWSKRTMFDLDGINAMNTKMPLATLKKIALHPNLPDYLKRTVLISVWTRAVLLKDEKTALEIAPKLAEQVPELKTFIPNYINASDKQSRSYEAIWLIIKNPAMRPLTESGEGRMSPFSEIDSFRDNWWCETSFKEPEKDYDGNPLPQSQPPTFLTEADTLKAKAENASLTALDSGSNFLAVQAVAWAKTYPTDPRLPEALHLAVKGTRYGCQNCATGKASKAAFDLLKAKYLTSPWKKKTPYWFKDEGCETK